MTEDELNDIVIGELARFKLMANPLPKRPDEKTADLIARDGLQNYIMEAKCRDRSAAIESLVNPLDVGHSVLADPETANFKNSLSSTIKCGVKQLTTSAVSDRDFRLLWLHPGTDDPSADKEQFEATLCGRMYLLEIGSCDEVIGDEGIKCYFFSESAFFSYRTKLDGAFICDENGWFFALNPYSPRYHALQKSTLVTALGRCAQDPYKLEGEGKLLIADFDCDRRNQDAVISCLAAKYGKRFKPIAPKRFGLYFRWG